MNIQRFLFIWILCSTSLFSMNLEILKILQQKDGLAFQDHIKHYPSTAQSKIFFELFQQLGTPELLKAYDEICIKKGIDTRAFYASLYQEGLIYCARANNIPLATYLLKRRCSHIKDDKGKTPLENAIKKGHEAMFNLLLSARHSCACTTEEDQSIFTTVGALYTTFFLKYDKYNINKNYHDRLLAEALLTLYDEYGWGEITQSDTLTRMMQRLIMASKKRHALRDDVLMCEIAMEIRFPNIEKALLWIQAGSYRLPVAKEDAVAILSFLFEAPSFSSYFKKFVEKNVIDILQLLPPESFEQALILQSTKNFRTLFKYLHLTPQQKGVEQTIVNNLDQALEKHSTTWQPYVEEIKTLRNYENNLQMQHYCAHRSCVEKQFTDTTFILQN